MRSGPVAQVAITRKGEKQKWTGGFLKPLRTR